MKFDDRKRFCFTSTVGVIIVIVFWQGLATILKYTKQKSQRNAVLIQIEMLNANN